MGGFMRKIILAVALVVVMAGTASAFSGNELSKECVSNFQFCEGYIFGVKSGVGQQALSTWGRLLVQNGEEDKTPHPICIPEGVTTTQLAKVIIKYLDLNPEFLHYTAAQLVREGLMINYPCSGKEEG